MKFPSPFLALLLVLGLAPCGFAQPYTFSTWAGVSGFQGTTNGTGAAARFILPNSLAFGPDGFLYVGEGLNLAVRKISPAAVVTSLGALPTGPHGIAVDGSGNIFVADEANHTIRQITPAGVTTLFAGESGTAGSSDGTGTAARFYNPRGLTIDTSGNLYVTETSGCTVRKITPAGVVTTVAGLSTASGSVDGTGSAARFNTPCGIAVHSATNTLYVADSANHTIRRIAPGGVVSTLAGLTGAFGSADGTGTAARFAFPHGIAVDAAGAVYVADRNNSAIRKISATGVVITVGGLAGSTGSNGGVGSAARFYSPSAIAVDTGGNLYIADEGDSPIRRGAAPNQFPAITQQPVATTIDAVVGSGTFSADATGNPFPTFQWQRQPAAGGAFVDVANSAPFSGATTKTLTITAPSFAMNGDQFRCVATNTSGSATSAAAGLTVTDHPVITTQPSHQLVTTGQTATFTVVASAGGALNYQWRRAGFNIAGATAATYTLANATRADADDYDVFIFPVGGGAVATSNRATLRVAPSSYPALVAPDPAWDVQPENDAASVSAILRLPDGRSYVGGAFLRAGGLRRTSVLRLAADGTVDASFAPPEIDNTVSALAVQADGRLVISGAFSRVDGVIRNRLARLEADGRVDPSFNPGGAGPSSTPAAVAALPDGNIVLGGAFSSYNGASVNRLTWLDSSGALLPGPRNDPAGGATAQINALLALPGGRLAVGGNVTTSGTVTGGFAVLRADGTADPAFNTGAGGGTGGGVSAIAVQPDGKLLIGGTFTSFGGATRNRIARLEATGAIDATFDPGAGFTNTVRSIALQADGKIIVSATLPPGSGTSDSDLTRLVATGARDASFVAPVPSSFASAVAVQADGRILLGGAFDTVGAVARDGLARLGTNGAFDAGFDLALRGSASIGAMALLPDGKVLLARSFAYLRGAAVPARLARFNADGTRDTAFNVSGAGADNTVFGLVRLPDARIVIGGSFANYNGVAAGRLLRLNADGTRDSTYNVGGAGFDGQVNSIAHLGSGRIAAGGVFTSYNGTARNSLAQITPDGAIEVNFSPVLNGSVDIVTPSRDGQLIVAGPFTTVNGTAAFRVARISLVGALDPTFSVGSGPSPSTITAVAVLPDNRLLVAGLFTSFSGVARAGLARLNADGSLDTGFVPAITGGSVYSLHLQEDGKVIVRGTFTSVGGQPGTAFLARINPDGSVDSTFTAGGIASSAITYSRLLMRDDGNLFVPAGTSVGLQVTRAAAAPTISTPPASATVGQGSNVSFTTVAASVAPVVYQWFRNGTPLAGANSATLVLTAVTPAQAGSYTVQVTSEIGAVTSAAAVLTVRTGPVILSQFHDRSVGLGGTTTFHVFADTVGAVSHQWRRNDVLIPGATGSTLTLTAVTTADAGSYVATVTDAGGSTMSAPGVLTVLPNPLAYSSRQVVAPPGVTAYFAIEGTQAKRLLLRALGPTLATLGVANVLADPRITVLRANGAVERTNDNWGDNTGVDLPAAFTQVGALALPAGSKDAVVYATFAPGSYAVRIEGHNGDPGVALLELFDTDANPLSRLVYVSVRGRIDVAGGTTVGGLTMTNSANKRLLIRAIGPTLDAAGALPNPQLQVLEGSTLVASNDDWAGAAALGTAAVQAGAFALPVGSLDAALLQQQRIGTGAYTAVALGGGGTGETLLEFYDLPATGNALFAPLLIAPPRAAGAAPGAPLGLRALAVGGNPLAYQWRKNGIAIAAATDATLAFAAVSAADAGLYDVTVSNTLGMVSSAPVPVSIGNSAAHALVGPGYVAGGTITITNVLSYDGPASAVGWDVTLPPGWSFVSTNATADVKPADGATETLGWAWTTPPPSPVLFTYTVLAPAGATGPQSFTATGLIRVNEVPITPAAQPAPLVVPKILTHSADTNRDFEISLFELTRVIELYNTRNGTNRTGCYRVDPAGEDGFAADATRTVGSAATLTSYHSGDTRGATTGAPRDGALDLFELTRVIELYNTRSGTVRTGRYHAQSGTEDGFAAGP